MPGLPEAADAVFRQCADTVRRLQWRGMSSEVSAVWRVLWMMILSSNAER